MSDIFKTKINNQWVGIPSLVGPQGPQGPQGETGPQGPAGVQVNADWNETDTSSKAYILHKPNLATVATSGSYNDLSNKPTIPASPVQSNWNETNTSSLAYIQNKPSIPAAQVNSDWNSNSGVSQILNKPNLATVATSGSYTDLSNKPSFVSVTISVADWNGGYTCTKNVSGITSSSNVLIGGSADSMSLIIDCGVYAISQGAGTITFECTFIPTSSVTFGVYII